LCVCVCGGEGGEGCVPNSGDALMSFDDLGTPIYV
jgi:hypothetical protein